MRWMDALDLHRSGDSRRKLGRVEEGATTDENTADII